ncbi:DNA repair protein RAD51 homolog 3-like isoform X1 [Haematobia irritans]|uniref:DNA repair protein RAD51 homolog 3-like isoform X1 n=1 Tax=Haematobia irritans TaxID=7368 RepID=UPI003F50BE08
MFNLALTKALLKMFKTSAFAVWKKEEETKKIITLIKDLDDQLLGGIALGYITELCGSSGCGKTQMCLQLCINTQLPEEAGGLASSVYYVDTNQGFSPYRLKVQKSSCLCWKVVWPLSFSCLYKL